MICKMLSNFDLFRQPVLFYYNGNTKRTSFLGFSCSLLIYCYFFYSFFQSNLFLKNIPLAIPQNLENSHAEPVYFNSSARSLLFGVTDQLNNRFTDLTYFRLILRYFHNQSYYEERELKLCELEDVNGNLSFFQTNKLGEMFCLKNNSFFLEGSLDEGQRYIAISVLLCDNSTSNNTCKTQEEIYNYFDSFVSQKFFTIVFDDRRADIQDFQNPIKNMKKAISQVIDPNIKKKYMISFKKLSVITDSGLVFSSMDKVSDFSYSSMDFDFQIRGNPSQPLSQYILLSTKEELTYNRRYQSLAEFLANFIGVSKFFSTICFIFVNNLIYVNTLKYLINKLYALPIIVNEKKTSFCFFKKKKKNNNNAKIDNNNDDANSVRGKSINIAESKLMSQPDKIETQNLNEEKIPDLNEENEYKLVQSKLETKKTKSSQFALNTIENKTIEDLKAFGDQNLQSKKEKGAFSDRPLAEFTQIFKKDLKKNDSFILEHFSDNYQQDLIKEKDFSQEKQVGKENVQQTLEKKYFPEKTNISTDNKVNMTKSRKIREKFKTFFTRNFKENEIQGKLNLSFWQYLIMKFDIFRSKKPLRNMVIEKAEKTYKEDLDVVNVVTKLHDLDKLKILLLDEDQLVIFNFLSKPIINVEDERDANDHISNPQKRLTSLINREKNAKYYLEESYKKVLEKNDKISEKLIEFFDKEISILNEKKSLNK